MRLPAALQQSWDKAAGCRFYCTERIDVFFAKISDEQGPTAFDEDERIETVLLSESEMDEFIRTGGVADAKTLAAWMLYKVNKPTASFR